MADAPAAIVSPPPDRLNVAVRLAHYAAVIPHNIAVACRQRSLSGHGGIICGSSGTTYATTTFAELDADATRIARGLVDWGVRPGTRLALLVRPGIEFVTLVFALLRAGVTIVLVDPGLGWRNLTRCLAETEPDGIVAVPAAQAVRLLLRRKFHRAKWNVTVGRRWLWGGMTLEQLRRRAGSPNPVPASHALLPATHADDPAAIIFTSGSTGPPKGVLYTQRMFDTQVAQIQAAYDIRPGGVDLSCFPLFALFNSAMGVTTVLPEMDFSRPAAADPKKLLAAASDWRVTQAFASPAVWRKLSDHCGRIGQRIESLRRVFSCGATVPADVLRATLACIAPGAQMHTPYGATECLPAATIEAAEVLGETAAKTDAGAGVCVGRKFDSIEWRVIRITDEPIASFDDAEELPAGEIGELVVRGPQASPQYVTRTECNADAKIADHDGPWHRMGDVGYLDAEGRFWYCGRKSQRVETRTGPLFTECIEAIVNTYPGVRRSALVGVGVRGEETPVLIIERDAEDVSSDGDNLLHQLMRDHQHFPTIDRLLTFPRLPVDVRHNAKINRETLALWAAQQSEIE